MISKYMIFCKVIELGNFTKVAETLGYSQSAVSQAVKALEQELDTSLLLRRRDGLSLTKDGEQFYPYLQAIANAEQALEQKHREMLLLENSVIHIGTFTSVSRNFLPRLMYEFKKEYPKTSFFLHQGDYTSINRWILDGTVDFGFTNMDTITNFSGKTLYQDEMAAILPQGHPLSAKEVLTLEDLSKEPFILLDEGGYNVTLSAFRAAGLSPKIDYEIYDDYTILTMVRQGLGVSILYHLVINDYTDGIVVKPIRESFKRNVAIAWNRWDTLTFAVRRFIQYILDHGTSL